MKNIVVREAKTNDKVSILSLLNEVFGDQQESEFVRDESYWNWKFEKNVFGRPIVSVAECEGKIVAVSNLWPWSFNARNTTINALQACDSAVHKDYRGYGLFKKTRLHGVHQSQKLNYDFIFNFPNKQSFPFYKKYGWHYFGLIPWKIKIIKPANVFRDKWGESKSSFFDIPLQYKLDTEEIDRLYEPITYDSFIKTCYVKGYSEWRYKNKPGRNYGMVSYADGSKQTIAIFTINQKKYSRELIIVDILGHKGNTILLFKKVIEISKDLKIDLIAVMDNPLYATKRLWKLGFMNKSLKNFVVLPLNLNIEQKIMDFASWSLMAGMHDSI